MFLNRTNKAYGCSRQTEEGKRKISENRTPFIWTREMREKASKQRIGKTKIHLKTRSDKGIKRGKSPGVSGALKTRDRSYSYKKVGQYTLDGKLIKTYTSAKEAKNETNIKIQNALVNKTKSAGGYIWKY